MHLITALFYSKIQPASLGLQFVDHENGCVLMLYDIAYMWNLEKDYK